MGEGQGVFPEGNQEGYGGVTWWAGGEAQVQVGKSNVTGTTDGSKIEHLTNRERV